MQKSCDNCSRELAKFSLSRARRIYRYNNALLCIDCFKKIRAHEQLEEA